MSKQKKGTAAKATPTESSETPAPAETKLEAVNEGTKQAKPGRTKRVSWIEEGGRKPTKVRAAAKAPAPEKAPKAAPPDDPREEPLVVFAFRLSQAEREEIHEAAGPAKASRFVRAVALAAARRDVAAIQAVILEAQATATA